MIEENTKNVGERQKQPNDPVEVKKVPGLKASDLMNVGADMKNLCGKLIKDQLNFYEFECNGAGIGYTKLFIDLTENCTFEDCSLTYLALRILTRTPINEYKTI